MLRRSYLKSVLGTIVVASTARHGLFEPAPAAQPVGAAGVAKVPATVAEALNSGSSDSTVAFIIQRTPTAIAAPTADKAALLRLVAGGDEQKCAKDRLDRERAALALLQPVADDKEALAAIARGFGGPMRIQALLPGIQSKELQAILTKQVGLTR